MVNRFILILTSVYFLTGNALLPQGDFSALSQLKDMYHHCKTVEDPDMTTLEFMTGHLLNMECFFDRDEAPDEHELPHNPIPFHTVAPVVFNFISNAVILNPETKATAVLDQPEYQSPYFSRANAHKIFQPPRV